MLRSFWGLFGSSMPQSRQMVGQQVLPSQTTKLSEEELNQYSRKLGELSSQFTIEEDKIPIITKSTQGIKRHAHLEMLAIKPKEPKAIVIHIRGNSEKFQECIDEIARDAGELHAIAIGFNPRGVQGSSGMVIDKRDLMDDVKAIFKAVTEKYPDLPVIIKAHSLGGGYSAEWAANLLSPDDAKKVSLLWLGRTFSSIERVVTNTHEKFADNALSKVMGALGWSLSPGLAMQKIMDKGINTIAIDADKDEVIAVNSQLARFLHTKGLLSEDKDYENQLTFHVSFSKEDFITALDNIYSLKGCEDEFIDFMKEIDLAKEQLDTISEEEIRKALEGIRGSNIEDTAKLLELVPEALKVNVVKFMGVTHSAHNNTLDKLKNNKGETGQEFFVDQAVLSISLYNEKQVESKLEDGGGMTL